GGISDRGRMVLTLIVINVIVFVAQLVSHEVTRWLWLDVNKVLQGQVWRLLTYAFLHDPDSVFHILFNMLVLWFFCREVEELYGRREFLTFYLMAALVGGVVFTLEQLVLGQVYRGVYYYHHALGASAAVLAVLVVCVCHYPHRTVLLFFILPMPAWLL